MKSKFIKRLFSIILVMVTIIPSSSLLFACTVTEYESNPRIVLVSKELDETEKTTRQRIDSLANCFKTVSERTLSNLMDYYGPTSTPVSTKSIVNLNTKYDGNMVSLQAVLSLMTHALWKRYNIGTEREVIVLALSNYPLYPGGTQERVNITDLFDIDGNGGLVLNENEYYINSSNPFYQIDGSSSSWGDVMRDPYNDGTIQLFDGSGTWQGTHVYLHQHKVSSNTLGSYTIDENRPKDKIEIFFVGKQGERVSGSTYSFDTLQSAKEIINALYDNSTCNAAYMDHREIQNLYSESPVELGFVNYNDSIKLWNSPLTVDETKDPQPLLLLDNSITDKNPLFDSEEAKTRYISLYKDKLTTYILKEYLFGPDGEESRDFTVWTTEHVYIDSQNEKDSDVNAVISGISFEELYNNVFDSTKTKSNGAELDFYGNYDLFISTALYNVFSLSDLHEFENDLESIVRNKIIGIEDEPLIDEDYGPFHRAYDEYVREFIVDSSTFDGITVPSYTKNYKPVVSKVYCPSASDGDSTCAINKMTDIYSSQNLTGSLNSIIIYGFSSSKKSKTDYDDAFGNDSASRKEFEKENSASRDGFKASFVLSTVDLNVELSSTKELESSYTVLCRFYKRKSASSVSRTGYIYSLKRDGTTNNYSLNALVGITIASDEQVPLGGQTGLFGNTKSDPLGQIPHFGNSSRVKDYILPTLGSIYEEDGSGLYYNGIPSYDKECFVEFLFLDTADSGELFIKIKSLKVN